MCCSSAVRAPARRGACRGGCDKVLEAPWQEWRVSSALDVVTAVMTQRAKRRSYDTSHSAVRQRCQHSQNGAAHSPHGKRLTPPTDTRLSS
jgi:hypothetical protein